MTTISVSISISIIVCMLMMIGRLSIMLNIGGASGNCDPTCSASALVIVSQTSSQSCQQCPYQLSKPLSVKSHLWGDQECVSYREAAHKQHLKMNVN